MAGIDAMKFVSLLHASNAFHTSQACQVLRICYLAERITENEMCTTQKLASLVCRESPGVKALQSLMPSNLH